MNREQRLRRVIILCCHFARNMAYYRAGWKGRQFVREESFWVGINGNCIDIALLEWCKLFGDKKARHYWGNVVSDKEAFERGLLSAVGPGMNMEGFELFTKTVRTYRDKFIAHLDDELVSDIPMLDDCWLSARFYHQFVVAQEANGISLSGLPLDLEAFYTDRLKEAKREYVAGQT